MNELPTIVRVRDISFNILYTDKDGKLVIIYESKDRQHRYTFTIDTSDFDSSKIDLITKEMDKQISEISETLYNVAFEL
jgi:hypothetical protein